MSTRQQTSDVLVIGGGTSGCVAAIAAARAGADTLLIERYGFLGGTSTFGNPYHGFMDGHANLVVRGIPDEIVQRLVAEGGSPGYLRHMQWGPGSPAGIEYSCVPYDHETLKYVLIKMCEEAGVRMLLHTFFDQSIMDGGRVIGARVLTKAGRRDLVADIVVDATADGDAASSAGAEFQYGDEEGQVQNVTLLFKVGNVDLDRALAALKAGHPALRGWGTTHNKVKIGPRLGEVEPSVLGFQARVSARLGGEEDAEREIVLACSGLRKGEAMLNLTRTTGIDATSPEDLTRAEMEERKKAFAAVKALREEKVPGFESCYLMWTAPQVGIREARRIVGEYILTREDVIAGRKFADCIAKGAYPMDIHDPKGGPHVFTFTEGGDSYDIPYRCLVPMRVDGLLIAGRAVSCDHYALGSVRNQATVAAIGQAAGIAATMSAKQGVLPRNLNVQVLREALAAQGAYVETAPAQETGQPEPPLPRA
ncbi:MAG: FAD-dependent oxidoreductase [Bacteroidetes bacterium]|nr:FAD-dependent oxidoreductase [Bacteroidota bacterium]MCL5024909.1 FAD-dependent oxidoreductase [Chloroflexota bacterium]